jgi:hypothetical protein
LQPLQRFCPPWGETLGAASPHDRTIPTLEAVWALTLPRRRCLNRGCPPLRHPYRPAPAGRLALPKPALGLDGRASMGPWRDADHRSIPAISPAVRARRGAVAPRPVTPRLERSDAWVALSLPAPPPPPHAGPRARHLRPRWSPPRRGPGSAWGRARWSRGGGAPRPQLPLSHPRGSGAPRARGAAGSPRASCGGHQRRPPLQPCRCDAGPAWGAAPVGAWPCAA